MLRILVLISFFGQSLLIFDVVLVVRVGKNRIANDGQRSLFWNLPQGRVLAEVCRGHVDQVLAGRRFFDTD